MTPPTHEELELSYIDAAESILNDLVDLRIRTGSETARAKIKKAFLAVDQALSIHKFECAFERAQESGLIKIEDYNDN